MGSFRKFLEEKAENKGAFHRWLGKSEDEPITAADIAKGKAAGGHAEKMAIQAQNFHPNKFKNESVEDGPDVILKKTTPHNNLKDWKDHAIKAGYGVAQDKHFPDHHVAYVKNTGKESPYGSHSRGSFNTTLGKGAIHEEVLNELSKKTLGSYTAKAAQSLNYHAGQVGAGASKKEDRGTKKSHVTMAAKRTIGITSAAKKMSEETIDENLKAIVTKRNSDGSYDNVGMNNRMVVKGSEKTIRKHAAAYAGGKPHRIEYHHSDMFYHEPHKVEHIGEETMNEESPVTGTRMVSRHGVKGSAHHAEVRYNKDYEEYSVHHYAHGKHMGEGPVSYHGNDKEDAKNTAEHEVKRRAVSESVDESWSREPHKRGTKVTVNGKRGEISHVQTSDEGEHVYKVTDLDANDPYKQKRLEGGNYIPHNRIKVSEESINELSKKTLGSYINKSADEVHTAGWSQAKAKTIFGHDRATKWADKRKNGIETATKKLTREEIDEAKLAQPLKGHHYHKKSDAELHYIVKDAGEAATAMRGHSPHSEAKYLDQVNDAATVLHYRQKGGKRVVEKPVTESRVWKLSYTGSKTGTDSHVHVKAHTYEDALKRGKEITPHLEPHSVVLVKEDIGSITKPGDHVHMGFGSRGGAGFRGKVVKVDGHKVHIQAHEPTHGPFGSHHKTWVGPLKYVTVEKALKEETMINEKITDSKEQLERAIAAAERKAQAAPSSQTSSYVEALKKALRRIKGRKNIRADEVGLKAEETEKHEPNHKEQGKGKRAARFKFKKKYDKQNESITADQLEKAASMKVGHKVHINDPKSKHHGKIGTVTKVTGHSGGTIHVVDTGDSKFAWPDHKLIPHAKHDWLANEGTEYFTEELGPEHHAALHRYATANGRTWKNKLNTDWEKGHTHGDDTAALRQVRNNIGPSGLAKYKLDPSRDDHPNNAWKTRMHSKGEHDVKEEVQPLSELSKKVLKSYREKALNQLRSGSGPLKGKEEKRFNGVAKSVKEDLDEGLLHIIYEADQAFHSQDEFLNHAQSRGHKIKTVLRGANAHLHAKDPSSDKTHGLFDVKKEHGVYSTMPLHVGEGVETIDELSRSTLASYVRSAASNMGDHQAGHMRAKYDSEEGEKHLHKMSKRYRGILRATNHKRLAKEETITEEMSDAAHELVLHADNDSHLHHSSHMPIINNLKKKAKKGSYDPEKAKKLWKYHADRAAQSYHKQHGDKHQPWHHMFTTHDRHQAAAHWEAHHRDEVHE